MYHVDGHVMSHGFPTKHGDYVVLEDDTYGAIYLQSPEVVQLSVLGGATKTYSTQDFLSMHPRNLSDGFGIYMQFGLDYALQSTITSKVLEKYANLHFSSNA